MPRLLGNGVPFVPTSNSVLLRECVSLIADYLSNCGVGCLEQGLCSEDILNSLLLAISVRHWVAKNGKLLTLSSVIQERSLADFDNGACELTIESRVNAQLER